MNREVSTPIARVRAKPRTAPEPNWNMMAAAIRVVTLASTMETSARRKPWSAARSGVRPARASSRIRS